MIALDWIAWAPPTFNFYLNKNGPFSLNFFSLKEKKRKDRLLVVGGKNI